MTLKGFVSGEMIRRSTYEKPTLHADDALASDLLSLSP
jgi:hypothetical protein